MQKTILPATGLALLISAGAALAADLPSRKQAPVYVPPPPAFTWTGAYAGLNIGGGWSNGWSGARGYVLGGGQIGYNYQLSQLFVVGLETDFQGASSRRLNWFGTVRGRLGVTPFNPNLLIYGTGGFAYGEGGGWNNGWGNGWGGGGVKTGWTAGGGAEWAFTPRWSAKVEYLHTELSGGGGGWGGNGWWGGSSRRNRSNLVRLGVNYHFDAASPAPVFAKY